MLRPATDLSTLLEINRSHFFFPVVKMKFKRIRRLSLKGNKVNTVYKTWRGTPLELRKLRRPQLSLVTHLKLESIGSVMPKLFLHRQQNTKNIETKNQEIILIFF